jgi:hypothetical protein
MMNEGIDRVKAIQRRGGEFRISDSGFRIDEAAELGARGHGGGIHHRGTENTKFGGRMGMGVFDVVNRTVQLAWTVRVKGALLAQKTEMAQSPREMWSSAWAEVLPRRG